MAAKILAQTGGRVPATSASEPYLPRLRVADNCIDHVVRMGFRVPDWVQNERIKSVHEKRLNLSRGGNRAIRVASTTMDWDPKTCWDLTTIELHRSSPAFYIYSGFPSL